MSTINIPKPEIQPNSDQILAAFHGNIETWEKRVQSLYQEKEREKTPETPEALEELNQLKAFLNGRLKKRLNAIRQYPEELRIKYLKCLEPFYTEEGITRFMGHYFDVEVFKQVRLRYRKKKDFEKEVNILFDLYRVKKTIETISTLQKSVASNQPFESQFAKEEQAEFLRVLKEIFKLFFIRFVKKEERKALFNSLSETRLEMDEITQRRKQGLSYINPEAIQSNEYREKFITVFFSTLLRTKTNVEIKDLHFNYLNFELLKNEYLSDWMQKKLKGNPEKDKVLQKYMLGGKSVSQLIKENPEKEAEILASLPIDAFNDIAEEINEKVKDEDKSPVSTFSKNHGVFARLQSSFEAVKQVARFSVEKMEEFKPKTKIWTVKKKPQAPEPKPEKEEKPAKKLEIKYGLQALKMEDLDFPFFDKNPTTYAAKIQFLRKKIESEYETFKADVWRLFNLLSREHFIIRKDPVHEWILPFLFSYEKRHYLLILGAEITLKDQQVGYQSRWKKSMYAFNTFFIFGTQLPNEQYGKVVETRQVKKVPFRQYSFAVPAVFAEVRKFLTQLIQSRDKEIFKNSALQFRKEGEPFEELDELSKLVGLDKDGKPLKEEPDSETAEESDEKKAENAAGNEQPKEKPKSINEVAQQLKKEMEEEKRNPKKPDETQRKNRTKSMAEVAQELKEQMKEEKARKAAEAALGVDGKEKAPQKPKDIREVAQELRKELKPESAPGS